MKKYPKTSKHNYRRKGALERYEEQLEKGTKTSKDGLSKLPLTDKDIKRINTQISILKERIT